MSNIKKLMMSGAAGGDVLDVDDVFSPYLYRGNGSTQTITNGLALADGVGGGTSTKFSGESGNNLRRTSDFSGNSDSTTFTFSAWVINDGDGSSQKFIYSADDGTYAFSVLLNQTDLQISGWQGTTRRLYATQSGGNLPYGSWFHVLISVDLSSSSNRYVYINDVNKTSQFSWSNYSYDPIEFTRSNHNIGQQAIYAGAFKGNLAHVYLDYTYRNLSTTSNRRIFIDADGGSTPPSTLSALNPIMYLPMTEDYSLGENLGTGGDLVANGPPTIVNKGTEYLSGHGQGGLVWIKGREGSSPDHLLFDTERGVYNYLRTNATNEQFSNTTMLTSFNTDGFSVGSNAYVNYGGTSASFPKTFSSWTFRKAPKFFDVQTFTTTYNNNPNVISHDLSGELGCAILKQRDYGTQGYNWVVYHRSLGLNKYLRLNSTTGQISDTNSFTAVDNSAGTISVGYPMSDIGSRIVSGGAETSNWVGYFFAHNNGDGEFGPDSDQDIIKCGSYTGNGSSGHFINIGFEPQWLMIKRTDSSGSWYIWDDGRSFKGEGGEGIALRAENAGAQQRTSSLTITPSAQGFTIDTTSNINGNNDSFLYMAIRRGSLFPPESASEVFAVANHGASNPAWVSGFRTDMAYTIGGGAPYASDRLRGPKLTSMFSTAAEANNNNVTWDWSNGYHSGTSYSPAKAHMWKRAPGFFDVVTYTGNGSVRTISHNLGAVPEMMWVTDRDTYAPRKVYHKATGNTKRFYGLTVNQAAVAEPYTWNNTSPTDEVFTLGGQFNDLNVNGNKCIAYLFASLDGISKVGSYTGNGSSQTIDCGFTSGAKFVLTKRSDGTGNWNVWDTERGIVAGNDPRIKFNDQYGTIDSGHDYIDPHNSGFIVNYVANDDDDSNINGASYIFYAIA
jgi:hypothetical protein